MKNKNLFRLKHIYDSIEKIQSVVNDLNYKEYLTNWIYQDAIIRNFEIIGEAVSHVDDVIKERYEYVDWRQAKDMRNFLIHEYYEVDAEAVWNTIEEHLPKLKSDIFKIIQELEGK